CFVHFHFRGSVQATGHRYFHHVTVGTGDHQGHIATRAQVALHVVGFSTIQPQGLAIGAGFEFQRQYAHTNQVGTVNALETFSGNGFHTSQTHAFGGPVTGRTLTVVGTGNDDQRLFAVHVGFNGFPHTHYLAFRLDAGQRTLFHLAVVIQHHFVQQFWVGKRSPLCGQVVTPVGRVRVEVLFRQAHFVQVFTGGTVHHDRVGR